jgi:hypothetical protein
LPRLAIAAVFGIVIAEPLVLRVFQTGIVNHVRQVRQDAIDQLSTSLVACNPIPGVAVSLSTPQVGCAGKILNVSGPASAKLEHVQALQRQESSLQAQLNTETAQLNRLEATVNSECNGKTGSGLTGIVGNGPACQKDQQYAAQYESTHPVAAQNAQLASIDTQLKSEQGNLAGAQASYNAEVARVIGDRLKKETPPDAPIGMAERFQALAYLSLSNSFISVASWFIRIFFILIDCLPVLVKFLSGSTSYDALVDVKLISAEKQFKAACDASDAAADRKNDVVRKRADAKAARKVKKINLNILRQDAEQVSLKEDELDELWQRKLDARRSAGATRQFSGGPAPHMNGTS